MVKYIVLLFMVAGCSASTEFPTFADTSTLVSQDAGQCTSDGYDGGTGTCCRSGFADYNGCSVEWYCTGSATVACPLDDRWSSGVAGSHYECCK